MTPLERLALRVSARIRAADLVLVLDYAAELKRETRLEALRDALSVMVRFSSDTGPYPTLMETALRGMIEKETADGP